MLPNKPRVEHLFVAATSLNGQRFPDWEYHVHSTYSDGSASLSELIQVARVQGIKRLIFTEHTEPELTENGNWFARYWQEIEANRQTEKILQIICGLEVPITDYTGGLLIDKEMLDKVEFLLGAVHAYPGTGAGAAKEPEALIDREFRGLMALAKNPLVDAIAHPGGTCQRLGARFPLALFAEVVQEATRHGVAIELNPAYHAPLAPYLEICCQYHAWISPGSNAHHPEEIGWAAHSLRSLQNKIKC
ncbi:MAG: PHP domain-containing protein [Magnetococcales bacterium]|nr:PHP domain-containing protein [Magnetococcales bacterium]